jgi:3-methyladenine DNA glycosylase Tag
MSASHAVMELVRSNSVLSLMVMQMREAGLSWRGVNTAIEAYI